MSAKYYSMQNLRFMLYEVHDILSITKHPYFAAHDTESCNMVLDAAADISEKILRPGFRESDRQQPEIINGEVKVHHSLHHAYKVFCESGMLASSFDERYGGQQLPETVCALVDFINGNANSSFEIYTNLSGGAARVIVTFGSKELIETYTTKILAGEWTATMCLTETQAGSSLSDITTTAFLREDGSYSIKGQKIFISSGDHDITENIVHLVLARIDGAPKGVKGISLFVVPKKRIDTSGALINNDVASIDVYHKMGQHSAPAMHLEFGANNKCIGYLIGEQGKGLAYMFKMMNLSRLKVGLAGAYIGSAAYYTSLQYAKERPQGRRLNNRHPDGPQTAIIYHPDVRRMLFLQKAITEGILALVMQCYKYIDLEKISNGEEKQRYNDLIELLTPIAKTYGSEMGIISVNNGLQVLGGYGYTEDYILEQLVRDIRILSLYEGTTGIQSLALLGREVPANNGRSLQYWKEEVIKDIKAAQEYSNLQTYGDWLLHEVQELETTTKHLLKIAAKGDAEVFLSDASLYMELFGLVCAAWQWLKQAVAAQKSSERADVSKDDLLFYESKMETMQFFFHYELRKTKALHERLRDEKVFTTWKENDVLI